MSQWLQMLAVDGAMREWRRLPWFCRATHCRQCTTQVAKQLGKSMSRVSSCEAMSQCLGQPAEWAMLWKASGRSDEPTRVPIIIHEDGVPHFQGRLLLIPGASFADRFFVLTLKPQSPILFLSSDQSRFLCETQNLDSLENQPVNRRSRY